MPQSHWNDALLKRHRVEIRHAHLSPSLKQKISVLIFGRWGVYLNASLAALYAHDAHNRADNSNMLNHVGIGLAMNALYIAPIIRRIHRDIAASMQQGVIVQSHETHYPKGWISPGAISVTHPIFYVSPKGNLVFVKETRGEYLRFKAQEKLWVRAIGIHPWFWRSYLRPPKVPESMKAWAKKKIASWKERMPKLEPRWRPRPALRLAPARAPRSRASIRFQPHARSHKPH